MWEEDFAGRVKQAYLNGGWGNLQLRQQPNRKGRGHATHQPACGPVFLKGVNLSEAVSVCLLVTFMNVICLPSFLLCLHSVFVSALSPFPGALLSGSRSDGIVCLYLSASIATTAAVKGNGREVPGTLVCLSFATLSLSCYQFYSFITTIANWSFYLSLNLLSPLQPHHLLPSYFMWNTLLFVNISPSSRGDCHL